MTRPFLPGRLRSLRAFGLLLLFFEFVRRDAKIAMSYRLMFFFQIAGVLSVMFTFFFLSLMLQGIEGGISALGKYGGKYFGFVLIGLAFSSYLDSALRTFSAVIRQAQITGTLEAMLTTRTRIGPLVAGSALYTLLLTTFRSGLFVVFGMSIFQVDVHLSAWPGALCILLLTIASTLALGIFAAGFIVLFKQGDPVTAGIAGLSWLLSGILYPKEILPAWVQQVASFLPMTHTLETMRLLLLTGSELAPLYGSLVYLGMFSAVGIPLATLWFGWAVGRARVAGSLAKY
jgi:ABC-2 type transport system permease protein